MRTGGRLGDRLGKSAARSVLGREREVDQIVAALADDGPIVTFVTGIGGIGKSSLLAAVEPRFVERGARVIRLDGRDTPPTPSGFLSALGARDVDDLAASFAIDAKPIVVLVDEYDRLRLLDPWLRQTALPALPDSTRWVLAGRLPPRHAWLATPGWSEAVRVVPLGALDDESARSLLARRGVLPEDMPAILGLAHNHPLALELASRRVGVDGLAQLTDNAVLDALAERFVDDLSPDLRAAVDAMALLRRTTRPVLERMLARSCDDAFFAELGELPFVDRTDDGLTLHDVVRDALVAQLHARDPVKKRDLEKKAWTALEAMLDGAEPNGPHAWRLTADLLFVVNHPEIREGFFPENEPAVTVEAALESDRDAVFALMHSDRDPDLAMLLETWWKEARAYFDVARDADGRVLGFSIVIPAKAVPPSLREADPVVRAWLDHVESGPGRERGALFARAMSSVADEQGATDGRGALWLAAKRSYVESPQQWAFYVGTRTPAEHLEYLSRLGFRDAGIYVDGVSTLLLEFGAKGIWTWLRGLVSAPSTSGWSLDDATRGLLVDARSVALSPLEWGVIGELSRARGSVVTREELLDRVWKQRHTGSNVVDALVRLLRKKLGPYANDIETMKGHGYRLRLT